MTAEPLATPAPIATAFPIDDYTPYGYLNLSGHTRRASPKGVMRGDGRGFGWHFPSLASPYGGRRETYRAGMRLDTDEPLASPYHSSTQVVLRTDTVTTTWFMVDDDCLAVAVDAMDAVPMRVWYERVIAAAGEWGESGLVLRSADAEIVLQSFEDGEAFAISAVAGQLDVDRAGWPATTLAGQGEAAAIELGIVLRPEASRSWILCARGRTADEALARVRTARPGHALAGHLEADDQFWRDAPRLSGDWPDHWRRGMVYDLETLRMMVKQPVDHYQHTWDAMQIQAPRTVLAESAMDALALSWGDAETAAEMLLGTFRNAATPNVPCSREDGTYNMVSADGTVCGTGPQWGYPFLVAEEISARYVNSEWDRAIYSSLAAYLNWWLGHRRDADGYAVHACSWESGQDLSPRFGRQPLGGGHPTWHIRPVDEQAAVAHAAGVLAQLAARIAPEDATRWHQTAADFRQRTASLWTRGRYRDWDASAKGPTDVVDVMQLAPLALGVADRSQSDALRCELARIDPDDLVWPMFAWTPVLASARLGEHRDAGRVARAVVDRAYRFWDAHQADPQRTLPGIACEYWPLHGRCGGEGYGWGAFTTELLLSTIIGLQVGREHAVLTPRLTEDLATPGRRYEVAVTVHGRRIEFTLEPGNNASTRVTVAGGIHNLAAGASLTLDGVGA